MVKEIKGAELEVKLMKQRIEEEKLNEERRVKRFKDFDQKYEQKNQWFQHNIIRPAIDKKLDEFDREIQYNIERDQKSILKERQEEQTKKEKEHRVARSVQKQINAKA